MSTKKYVNGIYDPMVIVTDSLGIEKYRIEPSFMYQSFKEYYTKTSNLHENWKGNKKKKVKGVDWEWEWSFVDSAESSDLLQLIALENTECENNGDILWLVPHKDYPWRKKKVLIKDEAREIDAYPHFNYDPNTINKGFIMRFVSAESESSVDVIDTNVSPTVSTEMYAEFIH